MEYKVLKTSKLNKELNLKVSLDIGGQRVYVEFSSEDRKLICQRSFQNSIAGNHEAAEFSKSLKTLDDLKSRLGYKVTA